MSKKVLLVLLILFLILIFVGGFIVFRNFGDKLPFLSNNSNKPKEPVELTYWGLFEPFEVYQPLIEEYQRLNPHVTIKYEEKVYDDLDSYKDSLLSKFKNNESIPDIARVHATWVSVYSPELASAPEQVFSLADFSSNFYSTAIETSVIDQQIYAVPLMFDSLALIYNKDIFEQENINPPVTWSDFSDTAVRLTKTSDNEIQIAGAAFGTAGNVSHFSDVIGLLLNQSNIRLPDDMTSQEMKDTITFYTNFVTQQRVWNNSLAYSPLSFAQGKAAMMFGPSWQVLNIIENNPNLNIGVAPVPQLVAQDALTQTNFASYWVETVNKDSKNAEEAWKFLKWLSEEEQQLKTFDSASAGRNFGEPYSLVSLKEQLVSNPNLEPFFVYAENAKTGKIADRSGNTAYVNILKNVIEGVLNGGDLDELLQTAKLEYERVDTQNSTQ